MSAFICSNEHIDTIASWAAAIRALPGYGDAPWPI